MNFLLRVTALETEAVESFGRRGRSRNSRSQQSGLCINAHPAVADYDAFLV